MDVEDLIKKVYLALKSKEYLVEDDQDTLILDFSDMVIELRAFGTDQYFTGRIYLDNEGEDNA